MSTGFTFRKSLKKSGVLVMAAMSLVTFSHCAAKQNNEGKTAVTPVAYRVNINNESNETIRYRYTRLVPHQQQHISGAPQPQVTLDVGIVFETIKPGKSTSVSLSPGKKLTLVRVKQGLDERQTLTINQSVDLYITNTGIYQQKNDARVLIKVK